MSPIDANLQGAQGVAGVNTRLAAAIAGRPAGMGADVLLVAVSKTRPANDIRQAFADGLRHFGENYVQEAVEKIADLDDLRSAAGGGGIRWHMIGPLQSNKAGQAARHFDWVQSIDRAKIADALNQYRPTALGPLNVLLQVNISAEAAKSGAAPDAVAALAKQVMMLPNLRLRGLMAIVENVVDEKTLRDQFRKMRVLFEQMRTLYPQVDTLSMGMSQDYAIAVEEGATMVRVGSAIFGAREPKRRTT